VFSAFFRAGQVLETFRGRGIYQPAVDMAIEKLDQGQWVHLFGEGKVNQNTLETHHGITRLPRFKWGVGRILTETAVPPVTIPMWLTGFDKLMPEHRPYPWKFIPRLGCKLSITFGDPLSPQEVQAALRVLSHKDARTSPGQSVTPIKDGDVEDGEERLFGIGHVERVREGITRESISIDLEESRKRRTDHVRSMVTAIVQREVEALGRRVSGDNLGKQVNA